MMIPNIILRGSSLLLPLLLFFVFAAVAKFFRIGQVGAIARRGLPWRIQPRDRRVTCKHGGVERSLIAMMVTVMVMGAVVVVVIVVVAAAVVVVVVVAAVAAAVGRRCCCCRRCRCRRWGLVVKHVVFARRSTLSASRRIIRVWL